MAKDNNFFGASHQRSTGCPGPVPGPGLVVPGLMLKKSILCNEPGPGEKFTPGPREMLSPVDRCFPLLMKFSWFS
uniref:Uncharacterized protein n=1 Tax=Romanomermis culicivorax TaxID=13658 RepID=A0A915HZU7_ROMCU